MTVAGASTRAGVDLPAGDHPRGLLPTGGLGPIIQAHGYPNSVLSGTQRGSRLPTHRLLTCVGRRLVGAVRRSSSASVLGCRCRRPMPVLPDGSSVTDGRGVPRLHVAEAGDITLKCLWWEGTESACPTPAGR